MSVSRVSRHGVAVSELWGGAVTHVIGGGVADKRQSDRLPVSIAV